MSLAEMLNEIPKLSFAERKQLVQRAIAVDDDELTPEENAILNARIEDFQRDPEAGIPLDRLKEHLRERMPRR